MVKADPLQGFDKNIVSFVCIQQAATNFITGLPEMKYVPIGTCFFVGIKNSPQLDSYSGYLVTAKHVLLATNDTFLPEVHLRVNHSAGYGYVRMRLNTTNGFKIYTHRDKSVDLVVLAGGPEVSQGWKSKFFDARNIATKEFIAQNSIQEGDDMFFTGLFTPFYGSTHNIPICRFGKLSMITDEKIPIAPGDSENLYVMEAEAFGGNSGSPVFFHFNSTRIPYPGGRYYLAGILKGYFKDWSEAEIVTAKSGSYLHGNAGVALVTPAYYLDEILNCEELKNLRAATEKALIAEQKK